MRAHDRQEDQAELAETAAAHARAEADRLAAEAALPTDK